MSHAQRINSGCVNAFFMSRVFHVFLQKKGASMFFSQVLAYFSGNGSTEDKKVLG
jgi:hypothetical protein